MGPLFVVFHGHDRTSSALSMGRSQGVPGLDRVGLRRRQPGLEHDFDDAARADGARASFTAPWEIWRFSRATRHDSRLNFIRLATIGSQALWRPIPPETPHSLCIVQRPRDLRTPYQTINTLFSGVYLAMQRDRGADVSSRIDRNGVTAAARRGLAHKTLPRVASVRADTRNSSVRVAETGTLPA